MLLGVCKMKWFICDSEERTRFYMGLRELKSSEPMRLSALESSGGVVGDDSKDAQVRLISHDLRFEVSRLIRPIRY